MKKSILITISSKNPTMYLIKNIIKINNIFNNYKKKICIVDSDSDSDKMDLYNKINNEHPLVDIHLIKNKNYEYGAYKYSYFKYPNYDIYCCIQDTFIFKENIDISEINDNIAFTYFHPGGFYEDPPAYLISHQLLENVDLEYKNIIHTNFNLSTHSSFIVTNNRIKDIFNTLLNPPTNKYGSRCYERLFGLYFIIKNVKTISINEKILKIHGNRI